jgi:hypothetical protein
MSVSLAPHNRAKPRRSRRAGACLLALLLLSTAGHAQDADPQASDALRYANTASIHIEGAGLGSGARRCDVTEEIRRKCESRKRCEIDVERSLCPSKPLPGLLQTLTVTYHCRAGAPDRLVTSEAPNPLRLVCAPY